MKHRCSMLEAGPNDRIVIVHAPLSEWSDFERAAWRLSTVSYLLGGIDVLLRYEFEDRILIEGDPAVCHLGEDSRIGSLPVFELAEARRLKAVA